MLDPVLKADQPLLTDSQSLLADWGIHAGNDIVLDASGMGQLIGTDESVPVAASYPTHPITRELQPDDRVSAGALDDADGRRHERPHRAAARRDKPQQLGRDRPRRAWPAASPPRPDDSDKKGPVRSARRVGAGDQSVTKADPKAGDSQPTRNRKRASSRSAIPTSRATRRSAFRATATCS